MPSVIPLGDKIDTGDRNMRSVDTSRIEGQRQPYRPIRDDPKYDEIKKIIEKFPPEQMDRLKRYIQRWIRKSNVESQPENRL
jgi:hypothetical protein